MKFKLKVGHFNQQWPDFSPLASCHLSCQTHPLLPSLSSFQAQFCCLSIAAVTSPPVCVQRPWVCLPPTLQYLWTFLPYLAAVVSACTLTFLLSHRHHSLSQLGWADNCWVLTLAGCSYSSLFHMAQKHIWIDPISYLLLTYDSAVTRMGKGELHISGETS